MKEEYTEQDFKEKCWFVYGLFIGPLILGKLVYFSEGKAHSVEFEWEKGLSKFLIGWFHSHPKGCFLVPSVEDEKTMKSWVRTVERPLICGIIHTKHKTLAYKNFGSRCYLFKRKIDKKICQEPIKFKLFKNFFIGLS